MNDRPDFPLPDGAVELLESFLLGGPSELTREEVSERAGVPVPFAQQLWRLLGFAEVAEGDAAFAEADVRALELTRRLIDLGILNPARRDGLVRTWGRAFARLAEWQVALLTDIAAESDTPTETLFAFADEIVPMIEELQGYVWRRHMLAVGARLLAVSEAGSQPGVQAICFVDIVDYTRQSRTLSDTELVTWLEEFESTVLEIVVETGGRIIKNIGDELMIACDSPESAATIALALVERGADEESEFPAVRAGVAYGDVVTRLGDVFGPVVNIASRLTSAARPNTVLVDLGMYEALTGRTDSEEETEDDQSEASYRLRRVPRLRVKGYSRLKIWRLIEMN